jgi:predicted N-formylglutamate amidohydrolase
MSSERLLPGVVSVEHASPAVPARLADLGLPARWFGTHHAWDPGAATVGRMIARAFSAPLHFGRWSRLVADLNRSSDHPRAVPGTLEPGGRCIPANAALDAAGRADRLARYWYPYRRAVEQDLDRVVGDAGSVLHVSVHSFVERLGGRERTNDFGLLYDPAHPGERRLADRLDRHLTRQGFRVRRNFPYTGREDGFCMRMRVERDWSRYLGMEIELNQRSARRPAGAKRLGEAIVAAFRAAGGS